MLKSIIGVAFLATPHRGSDVAKFGHVIGTIVNAFTATATSGARSRVVRADLLDHLKFHSDELHDLNEDARGRLQSLAVVSCHELYPTSPLSLLVSELASFIRQ